VTRGFIITYSIRVCLELKFYQLMQLHVLGVGNDKEGNVGAKIFPKRNRS
jgi:hypothetical protein